MDQLSGDQQKDSQLIGQFGVGFYSSFIVANRVEVISRKAGEDAATRWESTGEDEFSIDVAERDVPGTTVILHLDAEAEEFASSWRVRSVIKKYSDHISVPVFMLETPPPADDDDGETPEPSWERINEAKALWTRSRSEVSDDEYTEFYRHVSSDYQDPLSWSHNRVEGKLITPRFSTSQVRRRLISGIERVPVVLSSISSARLSWTMPSSFCRSTCVL